MQRLGAWLWRHHPDRFVGWMIATTTVLVILGLFIPAVAIGSMYLQLSLADGLVWLGCSVLVTVVTQAVVARSVRTIAAPIRAWSRGDRQHPRETWNAIVRMPQVLGARSGILALPFHGLLALPVAVTLAEPGGTGLAGLAVAYPLRHDPPPPRRRSGRSPARDGARPAGSVTSVSITPRRRHARVSPRSHGRRSSRAPVQGS